MFSPREEDATITEMAQVIYERMNMGCLIYLKWTCPACGERVTSTSPLTLTDHPEFPGYKIVAFPPGYRHDEKDDGSPCGHLINIREYRFNYTVIIGTGDMSWLTNL